MPEARGRVAQITQNAEAYREQTVAEAKGQTARFLKVFDEYRKAPAVNRQRIYLETMGEVLAEVRNKVIVDAETKALLPLLDLGGGRVLPPAPAAEEVR